MKNPPIDSNVTIPVPLETLFQILFVSQVAPDSDFGVVKQIVVRARQRNPRRGISGALLFDGERFCELIEGAEADARALLHSITQDPRHIDVTVLFAGPALAGRVVPCWVSGYCDASEIDAFSGLSGLRDQAALDAFISVLKGADVN